MAYIQEPKHINRLVKWGILISEKVTGKRMEAARLLAWYPKAAIGAGVLESLVAHEEKGISRRLLKLVRMQVSFSASCAFCIDMNAAGFDREGITDEEIRALQGLVAIEDVLSIQERERVALSYARELTASPIRIGTDTLEDMKRLFTEKQFTILVATIGQVNFWTRAIQGFGIPPAGFSDQCAILNLDAYKTVR
jgi:alkylhydroperoxidase family enzyme